MKKKVAGIFAFTCILALFLPALGVHAATGITSEIVPKGANFAVEYRQPPADFNPLTATEDQLQYYGYPLRPDDPTQLNDWIKSVSGTWVKPDFKDDGATETTLKQFTNSSKTSTANWSGYERKATVYGVNGFWTVPTVSGISDGAMSQWVGLGGSQKGVPLIQAGSEEAIRNGKNSYSLWFELVNAGYSTEYSVPINIPVHPGDNIYTRVYLSGFPSGSCNATFYVSNSTTGKNTGFFVKNFRNYAKVATSAEWISERPQYTNGSYTNYPKGYTNGYNRVDFWDCQYLDAYGKTSYKTITNSTSNLLALTMNGMGTIATPTSLLSVNALFHINWCGFM